MLCEPGEEQTSHEHLSPGGDDLQCVSSTYAEKEQGCRVTVLVKSTSTR